MKISFADAVMDLRAEIEKQLPRQWRVWARIDLCDFQFIAFRNISEHYIFSAYYTDSQMPDAKTVVREMTARLPSYYKQEFEAQE